MKILRKADMLEKEQVIGWWCFIYTFYGWKTEL